MLYVEKVKCHAVAMGLGCHAQMRKIRLIYPTSTRYCQDNYTKVLNESQFPMRALQM